MFLVPRATDTVVRQEEEHRANYRSETHEIWRTVRTPLGSTVEYREKHTYDCGPGRINDPQLHYFTCIAILVVCTILAVLLLQNLSM